VKSQISQLGLLLMLLGFGVFLPAQQAASPADLAKLTPDQIKARNNFEDEIAQAIITSRQAAGLGTIKRIHATKLRKLTCTFALKNDALGFQKELYGFPSVQLVASRDEFTKTYREWLRSRSGNEWTGGPKIERFAVGAWPAQEAGKYWVRFEYHPSAAAEWVDNTFTDQLFYKNDWKKVVAETCKKVD
jgi:hypothetical protein